MPALTREIESWHILVVDDEPDNLNLAAEFLGFSGVYKINTAATGQAALDHFEALPADERPNLVLLDLSMPGIDGWEVQRRLRSRPDMESVAIIALTALAMPSDAARVASAGFDGYVTKPFRMAGLLQSMQTSVEKFLDKSESKLA